jgi:chromosome segregation ATPase
MEDGLNKKHAEIEAH